jgi:hypothetical protein
MIAQALFAWGGEGHRGVRGAVHRTDQARSRLRVTITSTVPVQAARSHREDKRTPVSRLMGLTVEAALLAWVNFLVQTFALTTALASLASGDDVVPPVVVVGCECFGLLALVYQSYVTLQVMGHTELLKLGIDLGDPPRVPPRPDPESN